AHGPRSNKLRGRHRARGARPAPDALEDVLRLPHDVRRRAQLADVPGVPGYARRAAGREQEGDRARDSDRAGIRLPPQPGLSLRPRGSTTLGTKVEIKNLNSFRNVQRALEFEAKRQAQALDAGERIRQETRLWEADRGYTRSMRSKEYAHDYRYFPEPDLVPLRIDSRWVDEIRAALPELPRARRQRFVAQYGLPGYDADVLTQSRALGDNYEPALREPAPSAGADRPRAVS